MAARGAKRDGAGVTLVEIEPPSFVKAAARFARALSDKFVELDKTQAKNLRLVALQRAAHELDSAIADATADDSLTNPEPESYRSLRLAARHAPSAAPWEHGGKMRFLPRWVATVPGIDLRATFHCGERIVVGSAARNRVPREHQRPSAVALARTARRLASPRRLAWRAFTKTGCSSSSISSAARRAFPPDCALAPTIGAAGALVNAPGLPRLLVLAEGDRSVTAIDLVSGDVRWRYSATQARRTTACGARASCCSPQAATRRWSRSTW